jgi:hypothetical protein
LNFNELLQTIISSSCDEWHWMRFVFENDLGGHDIQITYLKDLSIAIRFGLRDEDEIITDNLEWLDSAVVPLKKNAFRYLDLCYNGIPVIRVKYVEVKDGKYLLPIPEIPSDNKAEIHPDELLLFEWLNSKLMLQNEYKQFVEDHAKIVPSDTISWPGI